MRLDAPAIEREIRRRVREEVKRSPALRKEHRRNRKVHARPTRIEKALYPLLITGLLIGLSADPRQSAVALPMLVFVSAAACFHWAHRLQASLFHSSDLAVLMHLPISNEAYVRFEWDRLLKSSYWILGLSGISLAVYVGARQQPWAIVALALGAAILHWLLLLSAALALVLFRPAWPHQLVGWFFRLAAFSTLVGRGLLGPAFTKIGTSWMLLLPCSWLPYAMQEGVLEGSTAALSMLIPAAAAAGLLPWLRRRLLDRYRVNEISQPGSPSPESILEATLDREMALRSEYDPELVESPEMKPVLREDLRRAIPGIFEERIRTRNFFSGIDWTRTGPLERVFERQLTDRERLIADVILVSPPRWSKRWLVGLAMTGAGLLAALSLGPLSTLGLILAGAGTLTAWPVFGGSWRGMKVSLSSGHPLPVFAAFPIHPSELLSVIRKGNAIRWLAWAPVYVPAAWLLTLDVPGGMTVAMKIGLIAMSAAPWMFILQFNGTMQTWLRGWLYVTYGTMAIITIAWLVGAMLLFIPDPPAIAWIGAALLPLSLPGRMLALRTWRRGAVDWMGMPPS